ncbi:25S rRNA adenine-N(1) methyltransferase [Cercospora zeina]
MANRHTKQKRDAVLKSGRPPLAKTTNKKTMSSKATQKTIVTFHQLQKDLATAKAQKKTTLVSGLESQIQALGGIKAYQAASIQGQSADRGGDSSLILMKWLNSVKCDLSELQPKFKMLEVGALSTKNACSKSGCFEITRIDLNSQASGILQQDFMQRPLPSSTSLEADEEKFDVIALSLVLNFVPSGAERGEMLRRTTKFLRQRQVEAEWDGCSSEVSSDATFPSSPIRKVTPTDDSVLPASLTDYRSTLFLVLPASCVLNSRYFNDERLTLIMASLGYVMLERKTSSKLIYYLWQLRDDPAPPQEQNFKKLKVRDGPGMNNFHVELKPET